MKITPDPDSQLTLDDKVIEHLIQDIGAMRLAHLAAQMENSCRDQPGIDLVEQLQFMQREYQRVNASVGEMVSD